MLISTKHQFVYLANPKTGTTSFEMAFRKHSSFGSISGSPVKHMNYRTFYKQFEYFANKLEIVTSVRDPLQTLYSWYKYRARLKIAGTENSTQNKGFKEFVTEWCKENPLPYARVSSSVDFVLNRQGEIGDLTIFDYGVPPGIHAYAAGKIGREIPELKKNVSPNEDGSDFAKLAAQIDKSSPKLARAYDLYNSINFANR